MKIYRAILAIVALVGIGLWFRSRDGSGVPGGQAGMAYQENENGQLVPATGNRPSQRTTIPERENPDGSEEPWLTQFSLIERSGKQIGSHELKGQPYVAGFFFSTCPSICVQQNTKVQQLQERFKDQAIRFVSISCDPEVDRPEVLTNYAQRFSADEQQWLFFTGKMDYIRRVGSEVFSLGVMRRGHPEKFALMDANGKMFGLYTWSDEVQWQGLQKDIERLIAAGGVLESDEEPSTKVEDDP